MQRPSSILLFERLYLGSLGLYLLGAVIFWSRTKATVLAMPQVEANPSIGPVVATIMVVMVALVAGISVLFWWLVARQRSEAGKWLVVVTEVLGVLSALLALFSLIRGVSPNPAGTVVNLVATGLAVGAAVVLFRPDAAAWFGERPGPEVRP